MLPLVLLGCQSGMNPAIVNDPKMEKIVPISLDTIKLDPVMNFLGMSFDEIKQVLGEPDEEDYSGFLGPHNYILYRDKEGFARFCSPEPLEDKLAVLIILGPGQEVLGATVGMRFSEIIDVLGVPDFGPELGMDNLYYMDYFFGETNNQMPEVFLSFSANGLDSHTIDSVIKWEGFEFNQLEQVSN